MATGYGGFHANAGRPIGALNKINASVRDMVRGALDDLGGKGWLLKQAKKDPKTFITLVAKLIPHAVTGEDGPPVRHTLEVSIVAAPPVVEDE